MVEQYATPSECSQTLQYAGYQSFSFDHVSKTCSYYDQAVSGLDVISSSGEVSMFWDIGCGDHNPQCLIQVSSDSNFNFKFGQQYLIASLNVDWNTCIAECDARSNCYAMAITTAPNSCLLCSQTTAFLSGSAPPLSQATNAVQMSDLFCYTN